ncbi:pyridoxamine 5'-phosphate oxidase [archaeon BMS3Abin16]|nr:pyridoxamine 5'-phosphate oxidase [archaeon BMS3Abin16]
MDERMRCNVEKFLTKHSYCTLATCSESIPLATVVMYVSYGLDLFFFSGERTKKIKNLLKNPNIAVSVEGRRFLFFPQAVEMTGTAAILSGSEEERAKELYFSGKRPEYVVAKRIAERNRIKWIKFTPRKVYTYGIGTRPWHISPDKQFRRVF